jgi:ribosomal subunit interface protein
MEFAIKTKNLQLTDAIVGAIHKRIESLVRKAKRFGPSVAGEVEVGRTSNHHKKGELYRAEVHVWLPGNPVYAEATQEDLYVAINEAKRDAERQVVERKGKLQAGRRQREEERG